MEYNEIAAVAAKWWADQLREIDPGNFDIGSNSRSGDVVMFLSTMLAYETRPSETAIDLFEERLADTIKKHLEDRPTMKLRVDYHPDLTLESVAQETGVDTDGFPLKTNMYIEDGKVTVKVGSSGRSEVIYPK